jgi:capsular exopolysaccharide synthesis family protein
VTNETSDTVIHPYTADIQTNPVEELVSFVAPGSLEADQYRMLRHTVERLRHERGFQTLGVTSAGAGDGKTVTTLNLAGSLAQSPNTRVLVVCADLHRDTVTQYLGLTKFRLPGLADAITNEQLRLDQVVRRFDELNVSILPPGDVQTRPYELLASPRFRSLVEEAQGCYDYVLVDTPPVAPLADCRLLARSVDGFIVVVAANKTPRKLLGEALRHLEPAKVLGVVFNGDEQPLSPYYGYYAHSARAGQSAAARR